MINLIRSFLAILLLGAPATAADLQLLMIEQPGCIYCAQWDAEISHVYPKTEEGKAAPLKRHQLSAPLPPELELTGPPVFTPTFILLDGNHEVGRIQGYPGEGFFWSLLSGMIDKASAP